MQSSIIKQFPCTFYGFFNTLLFSTLYFPIVTIRRTVKKTVSLYLLWFRLSPYSRSIKNTVYFHIITQRNTNYLHFSCIYHAIRRYEHFGLATMLLYKLSIMKVASTTCKQYLFDAQLKHFSLVPGTLHDYVVNVLRLVTNRTVRGDNRP